MFEHIPLFFNIDGRGLFNDGQQAHSSQPLTKPLVFTFKITLQSLLGFPVFFILLRQRLHIF